MTMREDINLVKTIFDRDQSIDHVNWLVNRHITLKESKRRPLLSLNRKTCTKCTWPVSKASVSSVKVQMSMTAMLLILKLTPQCWPVCTCFCLCVCVCVGGCARARACTVRGHLHWQHWPFGSVSIQFGCLIKSYKSNSYDQTNDHKSELNTN